MMTKKQAEQWVIEQKAEAEDAEVDELDCEAAFEAIFGRRPDPEEDAFSLLCA